MAKVILVTGGSRSGKSTWALQTAEALPGSKLFVATCPVTDEEMRARILVHQAARSSALWQTVEEPMDLSAALDRAQEYAVVLVDCLTLWINNLMYAAGQAKQVLDESVVVERCQGVLDAAHRHPGTVLFVTNEVGWGIVPDNALARQYRDLIGRCNQVFAASAHTVVLTACGIPLILKG